MNTIFYPTDQQCRAITDRGIRKNPALTRLYDNALQLLLSRSIFYAGSAWRCAGQHDPSIKYIQTPGGCNCPCYHQNMYRTGEVTWCKHKIAFFAYTTLVHQELTRRQITAYPYGAQVRLLRDHPQTFLIVDPITKDLYTTFRNSTGLYRCRVCAVESHPLTHAPRILDHQQLFIFSNWLAIAAQTLPKSASSEGVILLPRVA